MQHSIGAFIAYGVASEALFSIGVALVYGLTRFYRRRLSGMVEKIGRSEFIGWC